MKVRLFLFLLILSGCITAQEIAAVSTAKIPLQADQFVGVDDYKSLYFIRNNTFYKIQGTQSFQFSALRLGRLTQVDIINPLKITLFYEDSNTVVVVDNRLNEITRINFSEISRPRNVSHVTTAGNQQFWIFNVDLKRIEIFDYFQRRVVANFPPESGIAKAMTSDFNYCWIVVGNRYKKYSLYGNLLQDSPSLGANFLEQHDGNLVTFLPDNTNDPKLEDYVSLNTLYYMPKGSRLFYAIGIPEMEVKQFFLTSEILYIYDGKQINAFKLKIS
ncbi:hypothetical protein [Croceiramulus getboli]|nr:hypothetical protein P8624_02785 [Flavobacteriaceae bacterium YJPT1-3]